MLVRGKIARLLWPPGGVRRGGSGRAAPGGPRRGSAFPARWCVPAFAPSSPSARGRRKPPPPSPLWCAGLAGRPWAWGRPAFFATCPPCSGGGPSPPGRSAGGPARRPSACRHPPGFFVRAVCAGAPSPAPWPLSLRRVLLAACRLFGAGLRLFLCGPLVFCVPGFGFPSLALPSLLPAAGVRPPARRVPPGGTLSGLFSAAGCSSSGFGRGGSPLGGGRASGPPFVASPPSGFFPPAGVCRRRGFVSFGSVVPAGCSIASGGG